MDTAEPLRWLLEKIGDGVTLTQAGYLPRELVAAAFARYPHWYPIGKGPRSEAELFQLADLHELARTHRLVTKRLYGQALGFRPRSADGPSVTPAHGRAGLARHHCG